MNCLQNIVSQNVTQNNIHLRGYAASNIPRTSAKSTWSTITTHIACTLPVTTNSLTNGVTRSASWRSVLGRGERFFTVCSYGPCTLSTFFNFLPRNQVLGKVSPDTTLLIVGVTTPWSTKNPRACFPSTSNFPKRSVNSRREFAIGHGDHKSFTDLPQHPASTAFRATPTWSHPP